MQTTRDYTKRHETDTARYLAVAAKLSGIMARLGLRVANAASGPAGYMQKSRGYTLSLKKNPTSTMEAAGALRERLSCRCCTRHTRLCAPPQHAHPAANPRGLRQRCSHTRHVLARPESHSSQCTTTLPSCLCFLHDATHVRDYFHQARHRLPGPSALQVPAEADAGSARGDHARPVLPASPLCLGLTYTRDHSRLAGFADASWETRHSTSGWLVQWGSAAISWGSRKQQSIGIALSSCEAEIIALSEAAKDVVYLRKLVAGLGDAEPTPTSLSCVA